MYLICFIIVCNISLTDGSFNLATCHIVWDLSMDWPTYCDYEKPYVTQEKVSSIKS